MLALQEHGFVAGQGSARDRDARRRGTALLAALAALQHALLSGGDGLAALQELAGLADGPTADDPRLDAVLTALSLRARIELARAGR